MKILQLHCNFLEYEPIRKEVSSAEEAEKKKQRFDEVLVLFTSVEKCDNTAVARQAIDETIKYLGRVKSNRVLIYPYAHLSKDLASADVALTILREMETLAKEAGVE
ncbi:threonyl-tRNA synthetase editing domain-containing protein, partial [Candidatus Bathyarchaeota archaeon]|nr:threonyl-tRNA synthetase editing domain-containing protein [Candidatus Bathyarchaeota archaeon]